MGGVGGGVSAPHPTLPMGLLDKKQAHKTHSPTLGRGLLLVKGVPVCLKSPGIVYCERQPLNLKHRSNSVPARLSRA